MDTSVSKSALARSLGVSRASLYYRPSRPAKDDVLRERILATMKDHPAYGHRRIAWHLGVNKKRILRVMHRYHLQPAVRRRGKYPRCAQEIVVAAIPNRLPDLCPIQPNAIWVGDFTRLWFHGRYVYLATVMDYFTREIVSWQLGLHHTSRLVTDVLEEAQRKRGTTAQLFHSDQGSEYTSQECTSWLVRHHIMVSNSPKGKPWTNGRQESFYASFKLEFGKPHFSPTVEALTESLGRFIHYYNTRRIHSTLRMPPRQYCESKMYPSQPP
jgi:putative transposase